MGIWGLSLLATSVVNGLVSVYSYLTEDLSLSFYFGSWWARFYFGNCVGRYYCDLSWYKAILWSYAIMGPHGILANTSDWIYLRMVRSQVWLRLYLIKIAWMSLRVLSMRSNRVITWIVRDYPLNLSISVRGGKETNWYSLSNGEWTGRSPSVKKRKLRCRVRIGVQIVANSLEVCWKTAS